MGPTLRLVAILLTLFALPAWAEDALLVRSAEHPEYSRLLVTVPSGTTWAVVRDGRKATVSFPGIRAPFAMDGLFERMPRTRIVAVEARNAVIGSALDLTLACSCEVAVSRVGSRFLAIDVRRAATAEAAPTGRRVLTPRSQQPENAEPVVPDELAESPAAPSPVEGLPPEGEAAPLEEAAALPEEALRPSPPAPRNPELDAARDNLVEQLNRAAAEGLIELAEPLAPPVFTPTMPTITMADPMADTEAALEADRPVAESGATPPEADPPRPQPLAAPSAELNEPAMKAPEEAVTGPAPEDSLDPLAQMSMSGALAEADIEAQIEARTPLDAVAIENSKSAVANACPRNARLDVRRWGSPDPIAERIGAYRRAIVSDYGTLDEARVMDLAKFYISIGFGREAENLVSLIGDASEDTRLLSDIARVIEGREAAEGGALDSMDACVGRLSMWRVVAGFERL
ncbi:MAG: hypothetical protein AAFY66_13580, partial [Pseudomonadota bacterium]